MKAKFYLSGALLLALASCSNDESMPNVNEADEMGLVPVTLSMNTSSASVEEANGRKNTRGTGTVGSTEDDKNEWRFENLYVLMTTSDERALDDEDRALRWGFSSVGGDNLKKQFDNTFFARPVKETREGVDHWAIDYNCGNGGPNVRYYPAQGASDFFAYYVDSAAVKWSSDDLVNRNPIADREGNAYTVAIKINGSQDLMLGKAKTTDHENDLVKDAGGYTAKSARANIIPHIEMKHMLTRLTFTLKNGSQDGSDFTVTKITVKSKAEGKMYVAYQTAPAELIEWTGEPVELALQQAMAPGHKDWFEEDKSAGKRPLVPFEPIEMKDVTTVPAGEALFVKPNESLYEMKIYMEHNIEFNGEEKKEEVDVPLTLQLSEGQFKAGHSYHVTATIYGLTDVVVDAQLEKWVTGENIEVDSDNN